MTTENDPLGRFMQSFTAAVELYTRAGTLGCFIESVCLCASVIDGMLRIGLVLKHQLKTKTSNLPLELLYQGTNDRPISEREIYKRALSEGVIDQSTFDELNALYEERNKVVHRYIISEITTEGVLDIALRYDKLKEKVSKYIEKLETEQIHEGVGMTRKLDIPVSVADLNEFSEAKHGDSPFTRKIRS